MKTTLHILLIEDNPGDANLIREMLTEAGDVSFRIEQVPRLSDGLVRLKQDGVDLVLLDLGLPDSQGLDTFRKLIEAEPDMPVIVLTGNNDQKCAVAAVREGAQDFLIKGQISEGVLERAIIYALGRKQAEEDLRLSESKYRSLYDSMMDAYVMVSLEGRIIEFNNAYRKMLGYTSEELLALTYQELTPEIWHAMETVIVEEEIMKRGYSDVYEKEYRRKDGTVFPVELRAYLFRDRHDKPVSIWGIARDITPRKAMETSLRESEDRYRRLVNAVTNHIYTVRIEHGEQVETEHGAGCLSVTGYASGEYKNDPGLWYEMIHPEDRAMVTRLTGESFSDNVPVPIEHRIIHKTGSIRWVRNTAVPRLDSDGRLVAFDGLIEDITERKMVEEQLRQVQRLESLGQIAGGVAHDYNNAIGAIMGFCTLAQMHIGPDSKAGRYLDDILALSERATNITKSLLAFSRKQVIDMKPLELNNTVNIMGKLLLNFIGEDIKLRFSLAEEDLVIMGDSGQLDQVLMNLATNARDAMPKGGDLTISTSQAGLDIEFIRTHGYGTCGKYALLSVADSGSGIDANAKERIFEPFFTTKEIGKGTGLGLSISYGIVKQHNGFIDVYSEPGMGTVFKIYLPLIEEKAPHISAMEHIPPVGGTETILLVEDEASVRKALRLTLETYGYSVIEAADGNEALDKLISNRDIIKLAIIDVIMPSKNGKETYDAMRKIAPDSKAIFTSGYARDVLSDKQILDEGLEFVSKPVSPRVMLKKIRELLDSNPKPDNLP